LILHAGAGRAEKTMEKILDYIASNPGILRRHIMQRFKLQSKQADEMFRTLEDRGLIRIEKVGKGQHFWLA
jgi:Mn-dependent DtxR family transcriptional regulator